jgi:hypothetical protein
VPRRDKPNATIAPTHRVSQRSELIGLNFIGDDGELDASLCGGAID